MADLRVGGIVVFVLGLLALMPLAAASAPPSAATAPAPATVPPPVYGTVTNCISLSLCLFSFNTTAGTGWANSTGKTAQTAGMSLQLPGEAKASYRLPYSAYIARLTGTYTYWTVGNFYGTDVNTGNVIYGTTNTNYTITCHGHSGRGGGCTYTYTTDNGTIVVKFTNAEATTTAISCSPTTTHPAGKVSCTVTVTNTWNASKVPTGTVRISTARTGSLSDKGACVLGTNGTCSFTYHPYDNTCGYVVLTATYPGNVAFYRSASSAPLSVVVSGGC